MRGIQGVRYYVDGRSTKIDPELRAANIRINKPALDLINQVGRSAARYRESRGQDIAAAQCTVRAIAVWAEAGALLGMFNDQGEATRRWTINALAVAFLAVKDAPQLPRREVEAVTRWLDAQGKAIMASGTAHQNNHLYWAAAAVAAAGVASGNAEHLDWAVAQARKGLGEVTAEGALPREIRRGARALSYHAFALQPLVQVAGIARINGVNLYAEQGGALSRLADFVVAQNDVPALIERLSGAKQAWKGFDRDTLSWGEQYFTDTGDCRIGKRLKSLRPLWKSYSGGNMTALYGVDLSRCG